MWMRVVLLVSLIACAFAVSASGETAAPTSYTRLGITVTLPPGWHPLQRTLTPCIDPSERLAVVGDGGLVMVQERLHPAVADFPRRPRHFALRGRPQYMECCAPLARRGWLIRFGEKRRGFYVYVYLGRSGTRQDVLSLLDNLRVELLLS
jgi:hypothetical protein